MEILTQFFLPASIWFQQLPEWLIPIMKGVTLLGNVEFYLLVMPLLFWCIDISLGIRMGLLLLMSGGINALLKLGFQSPRPFWVTKEVQGLSEGISFGFPSGHAQNAAGMWGLLGVTLNKQWEKALVFILILLIGLSRILLGVHFLHDVLIGWLVGGLIVWAFVRLEPKVIAWYKRSSLGTQIVMLVLITSLFILPALLISPPLNFPEIPQIWMENAGIELHPYDYEDLLTSAGAFFGLGLGIIFLDRYGMITTKGKIWQLILRYIVGVIGVLILYLGLGSVFPDDISAAAYVLRFVRYTLIGLWIAYGAPVVFTWLKLTTLKEQ
ncbi:MAG: phosphatase PAP2 family protein [Anaerolineales bacterium]|nr:phosphatase PAP2 family protein [Anaerolineales bacterium]